MTHLPTLYVLESVFFLSLLLLPLLLLPAVCYRQLSYKRIYANNNNNNSHEKSAHIHANEAPDTWPSTMCLVCVCVTVLLSKKHKNPSFGSVSLYYYHLPVFRSGFFVSKRLCCCCCCWGRCCFVMTSFTLSLFLWPFNRSMSSDKISIIFLQFLVVVVVASADKYYKNQFHMTSDIWYEAKKFSFSSNTTTIKWIKFLWTVEVIVYTPEHSLPIRNSWNSTEKTTHKKLFCSFAVGFYLKFTLT